jgi:hypothetical protein
MAEFQWWLLIVGLVAGGGLVAVITMDGRRREEDLGELERRGESHWIADRLPGREGVDDRLVRRVLDLHREYLGLPPPDELIVEGEDLEAEAPGVAAAASDPGRRDLVERDLDLDRDLDRDPDRVADQVRDDGRRRPDQHLPRAREQQAAARQEAHAGADGEQRAN